MSKNFKTIDLPPAALSAESSGNSIGASAECSAAIWDLSKCLQQLDCEAAPEIFDDLIRTFVEDCNQRLRELHRAATNGDTATLLKQVHSIKGSSTQVGAKWMANLCSRIEECRREPLAGELPVLLNQLGVAFLSTKRAMLAQLERN